MQEYELVAICAAILARGTPGANPKHLVSEAITIITEASRVAGPAAREPVASVLQEPVASVLQEEIAIQRKRRTKE